MRRTINLFIAVLALFVTESCSGFDKYYYTSAKIKVPKVYEYTDKEDSRRTQYWRILLDQDEMITDAYNASYVRFESFTEKIDDGGTILIKYLNFDDEGVELSHKINKKDVFKWNENGPYEYSTEFEDNEGQMVFFTKSREYIEEKNINALGQDFKALMYKGTYKFGLVGGGVEYEYYQHSYYVKGIGMVKYERYLPDGKVSVLELTKIYTDEEWKEKVK
jgi:hypothetical protein